MWKYKEIRNFGFYQYYLIFIKAEIVSDGTGQTDSFGSKSDNSGKTTVTNAYTKPRLEIVVVIDLHQPQVSF